MAGWNADTAAGPLGTGVITLVEGSSFCISSANGDIHSEHPHGLFVHDTRVISGWSLTLNGQQRFILIKASSISSRPSNETRRQPLSFQILAYSTIIKIRSFAHRNFPGL
ncbi:glycogen debranching N-terminal domain-containing protein [Paenarthrobacter nitroguajacolicus]|uniref:glycogen debranching N-terminal domain-containing protein n=1 Tax=Paenarthrobacter nitroguajacolicus TaxID=211146 RepID=UPI003D1E77B2